MEYFMQFCFILVIGTLLWVAHDTNECSASNYSKKQQKSKKTATGSRTKSRYNFTYGQMKELGLQSLVNRWFAYKKSLCNN